jgi:hypothetical protein
MLNDKEMISVQEYGGVRFHDILKYIYICDFYLPHLTLLKKHLGGS